MRLDYESELSNEQAVTTTAVSTDKYDNGPNQDLGVAGKQLYAMITVDETVTAAGAATVDFQLQMDDDEAFGSPTTIASSGAIGKAALTAGRAPIYIPIPPGASERYFGVNYSVATGPLTAGKFSCHIVDSIQHAPAYPDAL